MTVDFREAAKIWAASHRDVMSYTTKLVESGVKAAVFSSVVRAIAGIALDAPPFVHGDVDLLIVKKHLSRAAELLPQVTSDRHKVVRNRSSDGTRLLFAAREVTGRAGIDEVQFVAPHTPVAGFGHRYNTAFSAEAYEHGSVIDTDYGLLPVAHLAYTAGMYGVLQRPKGDAEKAAMVLRTGDVMNDPYTAVCAETMGWDERVRAFLEVAGANAVAESCEPILLAA